MYRYFLETSKKPFAHTLGTTMFGNGMDFFLSDLIGNGLAPMLVSIPCGLNS